MSIEMTLILIVLAFFVGWFWKKPGIADANNSAYPDLSLRLDSIERVLEEIRSRLNDFPVANANHSSGPELMSRFDSIERILEEMHSRFDDLPVKPDVVERRRFDSARAITLDHVRGWVQGVTIRLISKSYYYPQEEPAFHDFEYRHDRVDATEQSGFGFEVYGHSRSLLTGEWEPYKFLANEKECTTSSCAGTIRQLA